MTLCAVDWAINFMCGITSASPQNDLGHLLFFFTLIRPLRLTGVVCVCVVGGGRSGGGGRGGETVKHSLSKAERGHYMDG